MHLRVFPFVCDLFLKEERRGKERRGDKRSNNRRLKRVKVKRLEGESAEKSIHQMLT